MRKVWILFIMMFCLSGCAKEEYFESAQVDNAAFHEIEAAEEVDGGVLYLGGEILYYQKGDQLQTLADDVVSLWREGQTIYYVSNQFLYSYNFETSENVRMVKNPYYILGKYKDQIISYYGRTIYAIKGTQKTKLFQDGYFLNKAVLYDNKVYGIPAKNVYAYDLDTLEVQKVTNEKHDMAFLSKYEGELYIRTETFTDESCEQRDFTYFKITKDGLKKVLALEDLCYAPSLRFVKSGVFVTEEKGDEYSTKGNRLLFIKDGKNREIDRDYSYTLIGLTEGKLLYYKSDEVYGIESKNLKTFYLYNGKHSEKAFDLNISFYEGLQGYEYDGGILIEVCYEGSTAMYTYDGETLREIELPSDFWRLIALDIVDGKAYMVYSDGEESMKPCGTVIEL